MVTWDDSVTPINGWQWVDEYTVPEVVEVLSVGFLSAETKKVIALAPNLGDMKCERHQGNGIIRIPRSAIKRLDTLRLPRR